MKRVRTFTDAEIQTLIMSLASSGGAAGFTEAEMLAVCEWAETVRINNGLLNAVLDGTLLVGWCDGNPTFTDSSNSSPSPADSHTGGNK